MQTIEKFLSILFPVTLPTFHHVTLQRYGNFEFETDVQSCIGRVQPKQYRDAIHRFNVENA